MRFRRYIALGDSISIDLYPALDVARPGTRDPVRLRRGLGAASLLHANDDAAWPEFRGRDLRTLSPGISYRDEHELSHPRRVPSDNLTTDGATTEDVLAHQLPHVRAADEPTLVTITAGGNDLLQSLHARGEPPGLVAGIVERLRRIVHEVRTRRPSAVVLLGTVYDPSDGTNDIGTGRLDREARWLAGVNQGIREIAGAGDGLKLADIHQQFLGHGVTVPERERWYWSGLIFEPNARGASEVRRVWLECLG